MEASRRPFRKAELRPSLVALDGAKHLRFDAGCDHECSAIRSRNALADRSRNVLADGRDGATSQKNGEGKADGRNSLRLTPAARLGGTPAFATKTSPSTAKPVGANPGP